MEPDMSFRMGTPPLMVDILPAIKGVDFDSAWERRKDIEIDAESGLRASVISSSDLIAAKLAAGRPQDLVDVAALRETEQQIAQKRAEERDEELERGRRRGREPDRTR